LAEIHDYCGNGQKNANTVILEDLMFSGLGTEAALRAVDALIVPAKAGEHVRPGDEVMQFANGERMNILREELHAYISNPGPHIISFCNVFLRDKTLMLDGRERINLVAEQSGGDLQSPPTTTLATLFRDDSKRREVRRIIADAFGLHFVIDPTNSG
jgi:hypothetical protein